MREKGTFTAIAIGIASLALLALLVAAVGATEVVQAKSGKASTAAKKCKKKHRKKCRRAAPPTTFVPPSTTTGTNPTTTPSTPPAPHTLTVGAPANGSVTSSPAGIDCPGDCSEVFPGGQVVTLTPQANVGYEFTGWTGDCYDSPCTLTMDADHAATPHFGIPQETLTVSVDSGQGRVTSTPDGIDCEQTSGGIIGNCSAQFDLGTSVTLSALSPNPNPDFWIFDSWGGDCSSQFTSQCTVSMSQSRSVSVAFVQT
jgi:List-Bact-rpt repeat protein